jgi:hypothetical protein
MKCMPVASQTEAVFRVDASDRVRPPGAPECPRSHVVLRSNSEYNVHMIAVNRPHHVFVSHNFKVLGEKPVGPPQLADDLLRGVPG